MNKRIVYVAAIVGELVGFLIATIIAVAVLSLLSGCASAPQVVPMPTTAADSVLVKLVDQNWLVLLGSLLCMAGVFTFLNGSTKGISLVGAGLTGIAIAGLVAAYFAVLADYKGWIIIGFIVLIVVSVIAFGRTAADVNGDGKVSWADVKDLMRKK